jgi:hypothetical protein
VLVVNIDDDTMTDTPKHEEEIVDRLVAIRDQLSALKRDRSTYLKSTDVWAIYETLKEQVKKVLAIRSSPELYHEQNRLDIVLDDVFQVLSLSLLTVGITNKAPATFASLCTVKRILDLLSESSTYTDNDLVPIRERLKEIRAIVDRDVEEESPEIIELIRQKLLVCDNSLKQVEKSIETINPELNSVLQKLVYIRREIMAIGSKPKFNPTAFKPLLEELRKVEATRVDDKFVGGDGKPIKEGQSTVNAILEKCHMLIDDFLAHENHVGPSIKPIYNQLVEMKSTLEGLLVTHRWTLRETDLYFYQKKLMQIEDMRVNGVFKTKDDGDNIPKGQSIVLYLIRRCYAMIYKLLESSEPVSEALAPIHNQLRTTRRCLLEVKKMGGLASVRELYPYQMKLASIDNLRVDGKFMVGTTIPEGQGMLNALLAECFDLCYELKVEMDESRDVSENSGVEDSHDDKS